MVSPNWEFQENDNRLLLNRYKGNSNEVTVSANFNGKQIVLRYINTTIIPMIAQNFTVDKNGPHKLISVMFRWYLILLKFNFADMILIHLLL